MDTEKISKFIATARTKTGFTQKELARLLGTVQGVYSKWERGVYEPNYENLSMLACIFDVSIDFLLSDYIEISKDKYLRMQESYLIISNVFPQRLKEIRIKRGLTQTELGKKVGVKQSTFTNWENGKREPNFEIVIKLADLLEVSVDWLFGRK